MRFLSRFWEEYKGYYNHSRPVLQFAGYSGAIGFPAFYLLQQLRATHPYDSAFLRGVAAAMFLLLALRSRWPARLKPYYLPWSYATILFGLPFFFIFMSLKNTGGVVSVANTFMAVFFLILLTDWRNTIAMFVIGSGLATAAYLATTPNPAMPVDYLGRLPPLILVIICGSLFKFTQRQIQAERLDAVRALAGSIAHEMRYPLAQLKHSLENIRQVLPGPGRTPHAQRLPPSDVEALYRHLAQSELAVHRGLQVISMTLDEVSAKALDPAAFSFLSAAEATLKAVQEYSYESDEARGRVSVVVIEDFTFRGDETAYLFVLFNLIKNALYYASVHPRIRITITVDRQAVRVRDDGPGIPAEQLPGLFEPFHSVGKSGGTGLGLSYCQRVMHAFGGQIGCESVLGSYTEFTMRFPAIGERESEAYRLQVLEGARAAFAGKRLLIVEDDAAQRLSTRHKLRPLEAVVDEAADGRRAVEMLARQRYDLVLLDLNMPVLDGYSVAERIREGRAGPNRDVRIVAYTGEPAHLATVKTRKAGMDGFVAKPCAQVPLVLALQNALQRPGERCPALLAGRRILLADDSPYNRKAVAAYLRNAGAAVVEADHGAAALEHLRSDGGFSAVLMDINMPGMNGVEAAQAIRGSGEPWAGLPIVALTAHSDQPAIQAAGSAGMDGFLVKPVEAALLYETLATLLAGDARGSAPMAPPRPEVPQAAPAGALLNVHRLESYLHLDLLDELLADYLPEIGRLVQALEGAAGRRDWQQTLDALHSLLGMSGEAGALALYHEVRAVYVPMVEDHRWPAEEDWLQRIKSLTARTGDALRDYAAARGQADVT